MANAANNLAHLPEEEDELGAAESAARLGVDGGPVIASRADTDDDLGDGWYDEELTDEELAALGEEGLGDLEDFADDDLLAAELGLDDDTFLSDDELLNQPSIAGELPAHDSTSDGDFSAVGDLNLEEAEAEANAGSLSDISDMALSAAANGGEFEAIEDSAAAHIPVPRISIHAFCETAGTTALLEQAAIDRRLSKTHLVMHMGGISKAVDHFQSASTPNLIILEALEGGPKLISQLGELAEVCDPSTKVIIVGRVNDISLYRELIRQGVSDYVVNPKSPLHLIKSIANLYVDPSAPPIGKTVAFVGARGGVGSSTIAHNVGWCAAEELESDTVILDLDLPFGTASLDFEQDPTSGLLEALASPERLDDVLLDRLLQKHTDRLSLFTAPNLLDRDYDLDEQAFETVVDVVRNAAPTIVVDIPHVWTAWSRRLLQTADEIVITTTPDLAAFRNTKNLIDVITSARPNDSGPRLVINQFDQRTSSVQPEQYAEHVGIDPICTLNWEPQLFHTAATNATPLIEVGPKTKTVQNVMLLTETLLGRAKGRTKRKGFDFSKLFKK